MKSMVLNLIKVGILAGMILIVFPQVMFLLQQGFTPPAAHHPKKGLPPPGVQYLEKIEDLVLDLTNQARQARGLAPLLKDEELTVVARAFSDDMLVRRFFDHTSPDGVSFDDRITDQYPHRVRVVGENIWYGNGYNPNKIHQVAKEIMADWLSSPDHRKNLLDPDFTHLGVGISACQQMIRATQEFVGRSKGLSCAAIKCRAGTARHKLIV